MISCSKIYIERSRHPALPGHGVYHVLVLRPGGSWPATLTASNRQEEEQLRRPYNICMHAAVTCQCQRPRYDGLLGHRLQRVVKNAHEYIDVTIQERVYEHADHGTDNQRVPMTHQIVT